MIKKTIILAVGVFVLGAGYLGWAQTQSESGQTVVETAKTEAAGNKICPVGGEKIEEKTKATYEYKGKVYNFCCPMCIDEFKKDPEKYIKKVEEEKAPEKVEKEEEHPHMHH